MKRMQSFLLLACWLTIGCAALMGQQSAVVEYLAADWGPAMTVPAKPGEPPQFSETEEEIYFLKQVTSLRRATLAVPDPLSGSKTQEVWTRRSIYLCKMKADGSAKTEIKELWRNPAYPIDTQGQSTWLDVNEATRKIALSITFAGSDITGLWTMNLDGTDLKRIIEPERNEKYLQAINKPSWTPDGKWIVFEEELRGMNPNRFNIARCDAEGKQVVRLLEATDKIQYRQPSVSPDGKTMAYTRYPKGYPGGRYIWLADVPGSNPQPLGGAETQQSWGSWPAWSPDGKRIYALSAGIIDAASGKLITDRRPTFNGKPWSAEYAQWGKLGLLGSANGFRITLTDNDLTAVTLLANSGAEERASGKRNSVKGD
jgi:Tol biopolymer transport system component